MKLTILGSATPYPRPDNPCSGYLVETETSALWMDAGTGTFAELQRHIDLRSLTGIFVSHGHADHTADLLTAYYALRFSEAEPLPQLPLFGPPGLLDQLVGFLGHRSAALLPQVFEITELRGWGSATVGDLELSWGPVNHGMPAFGLRVENGGSVLAYSGDTAYCESATEIAENADLFLCEVGASSQSEVHCTPEVAAQLAAEAGANRLVLTHITDQLSELEAFARAKAVFDGEVDAANPGRTFTISPSLPGPST